MADFWDSLIDNAGASLSRKIDNELNSDYLPSPNQVQPARQTPVVKTAENETGRAKFAGTGSSGVIGGVSNTVLIVSGVAVVGLVALLALR